jgi:hypothetical protein
VVVAFEPEYDETGYDETGYGEYVSDEYDSDDTILLRNDFGMFAFCVS